MEVAQINVDVLPESKGSINAEVPVVKSKGSKSKGSKKKLIHILINNRI